MPHPFIIGQHYFDRRGEFIVHAIDGEQITYSYIGQSAEHVSTIEAKSRTFRNILLEQRILHPYQTPGYFEALGFLSQTAEFNAEVPPQARSSFEERYHLTAGVRPVLHQAGYYPIDIVTTYDKWGAELRIYFPDRRGLDLPPGVEIRESNKPAQSRINNNSYWWQLVHLGFRLGTNHDRARIRDSVPPAFRDRFDAGAALSR